MSSEEGGVWTVSSSVRRTRSSLGDLPETGAGGGDALAARALTGLAAAAFFGAADAFRAAAGRTVRRRVAVLADADLDFPAFFAPLARALAAGRAFFALTTARFRRGLGDGFAFLPCPAPLRLAIGSPFCSSAGQLDSVTISVVLSAA